MQDGLIATDKQGDLPLEGALASAVEGRVEQVRAARLQRVADGPHDGRGVRGVVDHHRSRRHALQDPAGADRDGLHLRGTGDADADDLALRGHVPRRRRPHGATVE